MENKKTTPEKMVSHEVEKIKYNKNDIEQIIVYLNGVSITGLLNCQNLINAVSILSGKGESFSE